MPEINVNQVMAQVVQNLKKERIQRGLTQEEFCEKIYKSADYWSRIETGQRAITLDKLIEICIAHNISLAGILSWNDGALDKDDLQEAMELLQLCDKAQLKLIKGVLKQMLNQA